MVQQDVGYLLKQLSDKLQISVDADFKKQGITFSQANVLGYLETLGGSATQKEIEVHLAVSHPTVTGIVSRLEKNGFLTCYPDPADKRNKIVCQTAKAIALNDTLKKQQVQHRDILHRGLTAEEIATMERCLKIMYKNLDS